MKHTCKACGVSTKLMSCDRLMWRCPTCMRLQKCTCYIDRRKEEKFYDDVIDFEQDFEIGE